MKKYLVAAALVAASLGVVPPANASSTVCGDSKFSPDKVNLSSGTSTGKTKYKVCKTGGGKLFAKLQSFTGSFTDAPGHCGPLTPFKGVRFDSLTWKDPNGNKHWNTGFTLPCSNDGHYSKTISLHGAAALYYSSKGSPTWSGTNIEKLWGMPDEHRSMYKTMIR